MKPPKIFVTPSRGSASLPGKAELAHGERDYLVMRAEAELDLAQRAEHPKVVAAHYDLAQHYLDRLYGAAPEPVDEGSEKVSKDQP